MATLDSVINSAEVQAYMKALNGAMPLSVRLLGNGNLARIFGNGNFVDSTIPGTQLTALYAIRMLFGDNKGTAILYAAASYGLGMKIIHSAGYTNIMGIDVDERAVEFCSSQGLNVEVMDAGRPSFPDNCFDAVVSRDFVAPTYWQYKGEILKLLNEQHRILKPGGFAVFTTMWPRSIVNLPTEQIKASAFKYSSPVVSSLQLSVPKGTEIGTTGIAPYFFLYCQKPKAL